MWYGGNPRKAERTGPTPKTISMWRNGLSMPGPAKLRSTASTKILGFVLLLPHRHSLPRSYRKPVLRAS